MNKLLETALNFPQTEIWNDSCSTRELSYALENKAVGATTNPVIVLNVLKNELTEWESTINELIADNPTGTEDDITWMLIKAMGKKGGKLLLPVFEQSNGKKGRISFQTNAKYYKNPTKLIEHANDLAKTITNAQIKIPTSKAGITAIEELTYQGISINATVSFSVAQCLEVAKAVERGLTRRINDGLDITTLNPVCTIMVGRVDDYLKNYMNAKNELCNPEILEWAGVAIAKKIYKIYQQNNYRTKLLIAAYRNPYHWNQFIGGNIILTIPYTWQLKYNKFDFAIRSTIEDEVNEEYLNNLKQIDEFNKAYDENGLSLEDFEHYGAFKATINGFLKGYDELVGIVRSYMVK